MQDLKKKIFVIIVSVLLAVSTFLSGVAVKALKQIPPAPLGSFTLNDDCYTASATSTRVTVGGTLSGTASSTLVTCSAGSTEKLALFFITEASSTATVTYRVEASQDRITWYHISYGFLTYGNSATTSDQDLIDPFIGNHFRITANGTATTSLNLRVVTVEQIAK